MSIRSVNDASKRLDAEALRPPGDTRFPNISARPRCPTCGAVRWAIVHKVLPELRFGLTDPFGVRRCRGCGMHATFPSPGDAYLQSLYQQHYVPSAASSPDVSAIFEQVAAHKSGSPALRDQWAKERSTEIPALLLTGRLSGILAGSRHFLDVGAYNGENMAWLAADGRLVKGLEPNPVAAALGTAAGFDIQVRSLEECSFEPGSFDAVYMSYVFEHLGDPTVALRKTRELLKPGGYLLITTQNIRSVWRYIFGPYWIGWHTPFHLYHHDSTTVETMARRHGFRVRHLETRTPTWWLLFSIRAARDGLLHSRPNMHMFDPMPEDVRKWLLRLLLVESSPLEGDCLIALLEKSDD